MKLYWSFNSIPELADLPKEKRKKIWKECHLKCLAHWQTWVSFAITGIFVGTGMALGEFCYGRIGSIIGAAIAGGIGGVIVWEVNAVMVRPYIREYLSLNGKTS